MKRRTFLQKSAATAFTLVASSSVVWTLSSTNSVPPRRVTRQMHRLGLIRPPGSIEESSFLSQCIRCQRCEESCKKRAIRLIGPDLGHLEGTPHILPEETACDLCLECGKSCPTGAILPLEMIGEARMGVAIVDEQLCVSHNGTGICGACFTACPLKGRAIRQGFTNRPSVDAQLCVGCGLCEEACIVDRDKAIRVHASRRWLA